MRINIRADSVEIEGYVNAVERKSKILNSRIGRFIERIRAGAFAKALQRNDDVKILLNHDPERVLGSQKQGNLELHEDAIGLHARAVITDEDVCNKARAGDLVGWSFGFTDTADGVERSVDSETKLPVRNVSDLNLEEVSILDRSRTPAYDGTLVSVRSDGTDVYHGEAFLDEVTVTRAEEERDEPEQEETPEAIEEIDYSKWDAIITEMKGE